MLGKVKIDTSVAYSLKKGPTTIATSHVHIEDTSYFYNKNINNLVISMNIITNDANEITLK